MAFIHREEMFKKDEDRIQHEGSAEIIVAKHRNGPTGTVHLVFLKSFSRFENLTTQEKGGRTTAND